MIMVFQIIQRTFYILFMRSSWHDVISIAECQNDHNPFGLHCDPEQKSCPSPVERVESELLSYPGLG